MNNFKNFIFVNILIFALSVSACAQDIIVTTKAEKIEAKVIEIELQVVKYKKFNNLEGPTYSINKSDITTIVYQNGNVEVFEQAPANKAAGYNNQAMAENPDYEAFKRMNDDEMALFLQKNDGESYGIFHTGEKLKAAGKGVLIPGIVLSASGLVLAVVGELIWDYTCFIVGYSALGVGQACIITSIPLMAVGGKLKAKGKNTYEDKYFKNQRAELHLNVHPTGVGFSVNF
ncbi:MAG: hypothetical protein FWC10_06150 [Lentimicrobiaceae bacterium]|nr:hypothetical protein [Lentimicrobiaceae bacterium]